MLQYRGTLFSKGEQTFAHILVSNNRMLEINCENLSNEQLNEFLSKKIKAFIRLCKQKNIKLIPPEALNATGHNPKGLEVVIPVKSKLQRGYIERGLPIIGHISNIMAILSLGMVSFLAMRLITSNNERAINAIASFAGALYTLFITFAIYYFSGASTGLAGIGRAVDSVVLSNRLDKHEACLDSLGDNVELVSLPTNANRRSTLLNLSEGLGAGVLVTINAAINGITTYQQVNALANVAIRPDERILRGVAAALPWILICSAGISNSAFQWGFIRAGVQAVTRKLDCFSANQVLSQPNEITISQEADNNEDAHLLETGASSTVSFVPSNTV